MSNIRNLLLATYTIALLAGTQSAFGGDENARVAEAAQFLPALGGDEKTRVMEAARFRPAPPARKVVILKTKVVTPDTSLAFRLDDTLHTSKLSTGELFRQLLIDMPLPKSPVQASTPRGATDGRGK